MEAIKIFEFQQPDGKTIRFQFRHLGFNSYRLDVIVGNLISDAATDFSTLQFFAEQILEMIRRQRLESIENMKQMRSDWADKVAPFEFRKDNLSRLEKNTKEKLGITDEPQQ